MKCPKCGSENTQESGYKSDEIVEGLDASTMDDLYDIVKKDADSYKYNYKLTAGLNFPADSYDNWVDPEDDNNPSQRECLECGYRGDIMEFLPAINDFINRKRMFEALE